MNGVVFRPISASHKLGPVDSEPYLNPNSGRLYQRPHPKPPYVSATYISIAATCPDTCPLKGRGCYAQNGFTAQAMRKLDAEAGGGLSVIHAEARAIDRAFVGCSAGQNPGAHGAPVPQDGARGGRDLRLHVSGDVPTQDAGLAAWILAQAARRWVERGGGAVFTYTHQWRLVPRKKWGGISVLASCDSPAEVSQAREAGYPAALVVRRFRRGARSYQLRGVPGKVVPCPAQTSGKTCAECRLCLDRDLMALGVTIAFEAHGKHPDAPRATFGRDKGRGARRSMALAVVS